MKAVARLSQPGSNRSTEVMQADVGHLSLDANPPPCLIDIYQIPSVLTPGEDERIVVLTWQLSEHGECCGRKGKVMGPAVLSVLNREFFAIPVDIGPTRFQ